MSNKYFYHEGPSKWFGWKDVCYFRESKHGCVVSFGYGDYGFDKTVMKHKVFKAVKNNKLNKHLYKNKIKKVHKEWLILEN